MKASPGMKGNFFESSIEFHNKMKQYCKRKGISLSRLIIESVNNTINADKSDPTFNITTACGKTILFSECDIEIVKDLNIYYDKLTQNIVYGSDGTQKKKSLLALLFGTQNGNDYGYLYLDGNRFNLQRDNVKQIKKSDSFRYRPPIDGKKYKGVRLKVDKKSNKRWYAKIWVNRHCNFVFRVHSEVLAASMYNAVCDYITLDGYRNDVEYYQLSADQKKYIDTMMAKWGFA